MFVKPIAACGAVLLSGVVAVGLSLTGPALAASESDAVPANPVLEGSLQVPDRIPEANPARYQEAMTGTPDQSLWRAPPGKTRQAPAAELPEPALDKPMTLLNGLFESSETSSFPHP